MYVENNILNYPAHNIFYVLILYYFTVTIRCVFSVAQPAQGPKVATYHTKQGVEQLQRNTLES